MFRSSIRRRIGHISGALTFRSVGAAHFRRAQRVEKLNTVTL